ncbi:MAG: imidazole glycerol phosphate synthase subunit HisH, partial [Caulobacteraceae bacterium]|nr:imidazole glycerol phosphate synthase subunit HisH [Caulobacteraceae bacterium]
MTRVVLIDYGSGNLPSAEKALRRAAAAIPRATVAVSEDPGVIAAASHIVLPGVGAFAACRGALEARMGVIPALVEAVTRGGAA